MILTVFLFTGSLQIVSSTSLSYNYSQLNSTNSTCSNFENVSCPAWSYRSTNDRVCKCVKKSDFLICGQDGKNNYIYTCYCLTFDEELELTELGPCIYNCYYIGKKQFDIYTKYDELPDNVHGLESAMCEEFNRTGTLCGECLNDTFLRTYSFDMSCHECGNEIYSLIKYIFIAFLPLTILCFVVLVFQINIPSSKLLGYVFFCQIIANPIFARLIWLYFLKVNKINIIRLFVQVVGTSYGIWNLDFFRPFDLNICFKVSFLTAISFDFFIALYPLVIMVVIYSVTSLHDANYKLIVAIVKPLKTIFALFRCDWNIGTSAVNAFSTFMFLSNVKFLNLCLDLLLPVQVCGQAENDTCRLAVFYYPSIGYLSKEHLPYVVLSLVTFLLFVLTPVLILVLFPCTLFQKCLSRVPQRWQIALRIFAESFQGCYKDGTEPMCRDCRWFSVVPFILRLIIFSSYAAAFSSYIFCIEIIVGSLVLTVIVTIITEPYKPQFKSYSDHFAVSLLFIASIIMCIERLNSSIFLTYVFYSIFFILFILQKMYFIIQVFYLIKEKRNCRHNCDQ